MQEELFIRSLASDVHVLQFRHYSYFNSEVVPFQNKIKSCVKDPSFETEEYHISIRIHQLHYEEEFTSSTQNWF